MPRWVAVIGVVVLALSALRWASQPEPPPLVVASSGREVDNRLTLHVSGAVARPGLVVVEPPARVADAIAAAGGASGDADLSRINLAAPVTDGQLVVVPDITISTAAPDDGPISLNSATPSDLENLPGVGPVLAERIVSHRDAYGFFSSVEDLLDVPGIGEAKLASLRDLVSVP